MTSIRSSLHDVRLRKKRDRTHNLLFLLLLGLLLLRSHLLADLSERLSGGVLLELDGELVDSLLSQSLGFVETS